MAKHIETGKQGENIAAEYLASKKYKILARNWTAGHLELDIVAKKDNMLIVIEVKTRSGNLEMYNPAIAVNKQKQRQLIRAANRYILAYNINEEVRFDIISVFINGNEHAISHLEDAFYPTL